ncbi:cytochrome c oxidase subunit II [Variovorax sp. OV329]|uniref:cytochrome c oxidase subunit II n=1 Tax=Variovorax sp. OV329 TaxID=1882825 RepID=UPI0008E59699|nr:cytochrome c oxidase subunit II [Variovorax sp. OV329]SFM32534.1 cytochrome c oxidase subunit 2 [Variovorax sp. OV329]
MIIAWVLFAIVIGSVLFHIFNPWWVTPLASNWQAMDDTLTITVVITGLFFVAINLFVVYALLRFRHREGNPHAQAEPDNKKLERWLIAGTSVGVAALLAPGLLVYAKYVNEPHDALMLEVLSQQWQWHYRLPGPDGKLGASDARFFSATNPFGLDPQDPRGQDDLLVMGNEVHLPLGKPVVVVLRSHDVLHDFFVPQFRARMNTVPGQVSRFWFTPTVPGRYEALCAQLCGVGHPDMRGFVVVEEPAKYAAWQQELVSFAVASRPAAAPSVAASPLVEKGRQLADARGCMACHTIDGSPRVGPTWKGLYGKSETMADGSTEKVDEAYLRGFILDPQAKKVKGFPPVMPKLPLSDEEVSALVAYIQTLGEAPAGEQKAQR